MICIARGVRQRGLPALARPLCTLKKKGTGEEAAWFREQERAALDSLKAKMSKKRSPIDEDDEKVFGSPSLSPCLLSHLLSHLMWFDHRFGFRRYSRRSVCAMKFERR